MRNSLLFILGIALAGCAGAEPLPEASEDTSEPASVGAEAAPAETVEAEHGPRVVFLGTSLTAGLGLDDEADGYVARVDELADSAGLPITAVNAGVSGETSAGGLRRVDWILREPLDVLVLELGANDGLRGQDPNALGDNLREIIARTRTRYPDARVLIAGMQAPPNFGAAYTMEFGAVFPQVAEETGSALIPFLLEGIAGVPELNQDDRIHPTPEGHALMARIVWPHLRPLLPPSEAN